MLFYYHNKITSNYQYFRVDHITDHMNPHCHTRFTSLRTAKDFFCSHGQSRMYSYRAFSVLIKDFPNLPKEKKYIEFSGHRFRCISCGRGDHNGRYSLPMPFYARYLGNGLVDHPLTEGPYVHFHPFRFLPADYSSPKFP